jgi:hypothetical protein
VLFRSISPIGRGQQSIVANNPRDGGLLGARQRPAAMDSRQYERNQTEFDRLFPDAKRIVNRGW